MALSSIHDVVTAHGNGDPKNHLVHVQHVTYEEKHFKPNPDAKPFIPNPFAVASANWHFYSNENGKSLNGFMPPIWLHPQVDRDNLMVAGSSGNPSKKHIAFHLVSNVLDDEVPEDACKEHIPANFPHPSMLPKEGNIYNNGSNVIDAWHTTPLNFNLPLDTERSSSEKSSINNKSIHEIWSPDPSPNGLNNLSPTEENLTSYNQMQQQFLDSSNSGMDSNEVSFEQQEMMTQHGVVYSEIEPGNNEAHNQSQYCYQTPHMYHGNQHHYQQGYRNVPQAEMYTTTVLSPRGNPVMGDNVRPVYYPNQHYVGAKYRGDVNSRRKYRQHEHPLLQDVYDVKMSGIEELGIALDECRDQLKHLERDFRKADVTLSQEFRIRKTSVGDGCVSKYPSNSTRVDKLIVDQQKEHQKIEALIGRIERLGFTPMHSNVGLSLDLWQTAIRDLRSARKNELSNISEAQLIHSEVMAGNPKSHTHTHAEAVSLASLVKALTKLNRSARTIVWCAMQMLYANVSSSNGCSSGE